MGSEKWRGGGVGGHGGGHLGTLTLQSPCLLGGGGAFIGGLFIIGAMCDDEDGTKLGTLGRSCPLMLGNSWPLD